MRLKQQFDLEKLEKAKKNDAVTVDNMTVAYSQEDLIKSLDEADSQEET